MSTNNLFSLNLEAVTAPAPHAWTINVCPRTRRWIPPAIRLFCSPSKDRLFCWLDGVSVAMVCKHTRACLARRQRYNCAKRSRQGGYRSFEWDDIPNLFAFVGLFFRLSPTAQSGWTAWSAMSSGNARIQLHALPDQVHSTAFMVVLDRSCWFASPLPDFRVGWDSIMQLRLHGVWSGSVSSRCYELSLVIEAPPPS